MDGEIVAPSDESLWLDLDQKYQKWIAFSNVNDLTVAGSGIINGFGSSFWEVNIYGR